MKTTKLSSRQADWVLIPATQEEIRHVSELARRRVKQRAGMAAAISLLPAPGIDILADFNIFAQMLTEINHLFGLTPEQIARLPGQQAQLLQAGIAASGILAGKLLTRELLMQWLQRHSGKLLLRHSSKWAPLAGSLIAGALGYAMLHRLGMQHVQACAALAQDALKWPLKDL
ncbi:hypothetical protein V8J88_24110 [Massilia sp. W12]|uniref:hypothetical protein n=1 Tax=Massilia sp. W12 TaxID=3126507 RepID=UPI0030CFDF3A